MCPPPLVVQSTFPIAFPSPFAQLDGGRSRTSPHLENVPTFPHLTYLRIVLAFHLTFSSTGLLVFCVIMCILLCCNSYQAAR
ncbi:unnamed protein product [Ectocarpus sp. 4 AP-2014]